MCEYFDPMTNHICDDNKSCYIFMGDRNCGRIMNTIPCFLQWLFGGRCEYHYDIHTQTHHYIINNDDIGYMDMKVTNECFMYENINVRINRMCEEYDSYMRYKYKDCCEQND